MIAVKSDLFTLTNYLDTILFFFFCVCINSDKVLNKSNPEQIEASIKRIGIETVL